MIDYISANIVPLIIGVVVLILVSVVVTFFMRARTMKTKWQSGFKPDQEAPASQADHLPAKDLQSERIKESGMKPESRENGFQDFGLQLVLDDDKVFRLELPSLIGRVKGNSIVIADDSVSAHHARIYYNDRIGAVCIEDLNSLNGIFVDGRPTTSNVLEDGARLTIGSVSFTFRDTGYLPPSK